MDTTAKGAETMPQKKLTWILQQLAEGRTVFVRSHTRTWEVCPGLAERFEACGGLFKIKGRSLYMRHGKRLDCIDYCRLSAV